MPFIPYRKDTISFHSITLLSCYLFRFHLFQSLELSIRLTGSSHSVYWCDNISNAEAKNGNRDNDLKDVTLFQSRLKSAPAPKMECYIRKLMSE